MAGVGGLCARVAPTMAVLQGGLGVRTRAPRSNTKLALMQ